MSGNVPPPPQEPQPGEGGGSGGQAGQGHGGYGGYGGYGQEVPPPGGGYGYPPPGGGAGYGYGYGSGAPAPGAPQPFSAGRSISWAWTTYWRNLGPLLLITVVVLAVQLVFGVITRGSHNVIVDLVFSVIGFALSLVLALGVIRAALAVCDGRSPRVENLFDTRDLGPYAITAIVVGVITAVGFVLCIIPGIVAIFFLLFAPYVVADGASTDVGTALRRSVELVRSAPGEVIVLILGLLGINIVGALLCGVGLLFTYGISALAVAHAWRSLSGGLVAATA
ncbi:MAG: hypothetical protein ACTHOD_16145 [Motilibacteraceae bacterium]